MTREAMQQALDALEISQAFVDASSNKKMLSGWGDQLDRAEIAIAALRKAIAHPSPAWHDKPTCAGLWLCDEASDLKYEWRAQRVTWPLNSMLLGEGERWCGPIQEDKP